MCVFFACAMCCYALSANKSYQAGCTKGRFQRQKYTLLQKGKFASTLANSWLCCYIVYAVILFLAIIINTDGYLRIYRET